MGFAKNRREISVGWVAWSKRMREYVNVPRIRWLFTRNVWPALFRNLGCTTDNWIYTLTVRLLTKLSVIVIVIVMSSFILKRYAIIESTNSIARLTLNSRFSVQITNDLGSRFIDWFNACVARVVNSNLRLKVSVKLVEFVRLRLQYFLTERYKRSYLF